MKAFQLQVSGSLNFPAMLRAAKAQVFNHLLPIGAVATLICVFSGMGFAVSPNRTDLTVMAVSATIALAAAFTSDRKGGAK